MKRLTYLIMVLFALLFLVLGVGGKRQLLFSGAHPLGRGYQHRSGSVYEEESREGGSSSEKDSRTGGDSLVDSVRRKSDDGISRRMMGGGGLRQNILTCRGGSASSR
jgi:hypothetical protein